MSAVTILAKMRACSLVCLLAFVAAAQAQFQMAGRWHPVWGQVPGAPDGVLTIDARGMAFDQRWVIGVRVGEDTSTRFAGALVRGGLYHQSSFRVEGIAPERFTIKDGVIAFPEGLPLRPVATLYVTVPRGQRVRIQTPGGYFPPQKLQTSLVVDTGRVLRVPLAGLQQLVLLGVRPEIGASDALLWTPPSAENARKIWRIDPRDAAAALQEYRELGRLPSPREPGLLAALQVVIEADGAVSDVFGMPSDLSSSVAANLRLWRFAPRSSRSLLRVPVTVAADRHTLTTPFAPMAAAPQ